MPPPPPRRRRQLLLLHGNRQTGPLLLGRMDRFRKKLQQRWGIDVVAPDAPHPHPLDPERRTWWNRPNEGEADLEDVRTTLRLVESVWASDEGDGDDAADSGFVGILGFSQGACLAHWLALLHAQDPHFLKGLQFVVLVAGYDAPLPTGLRANWEDRGHLLPAPPLVRLPSLHVWGATDQLVTPPQSEALACRFETPTTHVHAGGHHVPMRADDVRAYLDFIAACLAGPAEPRRPTGPLTASAIAEPPTTPDAGTSATLTAAAAAPAPLPPAPQAEPDPDTKQAQLDEVAALSAIFPDEFALESPCTENDTGEPTYQFPLRFTIDLVPTDAGLWPPRPLRLAVELPRDYPDAAAPRLALRHDLSVLEFSSAAADACVRAAAAAARAEAGMPCAWSCVQAARDFFESGGLRADMDPHDDQDPLSVQPQENEGHAALVQSSLVKPSSPERIQECIIRGLSVAESLLRRKVNSGSTEASSTAAINKDDSAYDLSTGKGGSWAYTIGLVGKPSAGKSTFFNAATAFARQRNDTENALGGAAMAPHPFTTIDPNTGWALVPAPRGSCPEDDEGSTERFCIGNTHGRDNHGRRLIPVLLTDVAGLVPGAYQGRGRGNKFLNDLCDADVLIHVMDASGTADTEGNVLGFEEDGTTPCSAASNPLNDLAWIHKELIEWVYTNLLFKWDTIRKKGRSKLASMFNGYGQKAGVTWSILNAVEKEMERTEHREKPLDRLEDWDEGDIHLLVSAFLGVRFPMALALNKCDIPSSRIYTDEILNALPVHGAHVGVPVCAMAEMSFIKQTIEAILEKSEQSNDVKNAREPPVGVWQCLQSAMSLKEPILVFPVADFTSFAPLPGLSEHAVNDASLPSAGMIACLQRAGGCAPSAWDGSTNTFTLEQIKKCPTALRDVLLLKPGSTIEDVFLLLKRLGAVGGEFIRAEAAPDLRTAPKPVPKHQVVSRATRIVKIMTSKRTAWQGHHSQR